MPIKAVQRTVQRLFLSWQLLWSCRVLFLPCICCPLSASLPPRLHFCLLRMSYATSVGIVTILCQIGVQYCTVTVTVSLQFPSAQYRRCSSISRAGSLRDSLPVLRHQLLRRTSCGRNLLLGDGYLEANTRCAAYLTLTFLLLLSSS